jgi:predicted deacetylase
MGAKYFFRLDDIMPSMDWEKFWKYINLFSEHGVKPLLGIIPDNKDESIEVNPKNPQFWGIIKKLADNNKIDIAQHGYQHKLFQDKGKSLRFVSTIPQNTEFSGLSKKIQYDKILKGKNILESHGLQTKIWMPPAHTLDDITIDVLKELGFIMITDGNTLFPFKYKDLLFIPQQYERPRKMYCGTFTFCIHINNSSDLLFESTNKLLKSKVRCVSFSDHLTFSYGIRTQLTNKVFQLFYSQVRVLNNFINR